MEHNLYTKKRRKVIHRGPILRKTSLCSWLTRMSARSIKNWWTCGTCSGCASVFGFWLKTKVYEAAFGHLPAKEFISAEVAYCFWLSSSRFQLSSSLHPFLSCPLSSKTLTPSRARYRSEKVQTSVNLKTKIDAFQLFVIVLCNKLSWKKGRDCSYFWGASTREIFVRLSRMVRTIVQLL